jgi:hypothetical protein
MGSSTGADFFATFFLGGDRFFCGGAKGVSSA